MEILKDREKRIKAANIAVVASFVIQTILLWNEYEWYEFFAPYGTVFLFLFLVGAAVAYTEDGIKDKGLWIVAAVAVVALINILIVHSGKGAWFTAVDVALAIYLADKVRFSGILSWFCLCYTGFYFFYWTFDVKGYFKGYNTNYGGLVLITGFVFAITLLIGARQRLIASGNIGYRFLTFFIPFMFAWGYNIIAWYRARCALLGLVTFTLLLLIPAKVWKNRVCYTILTVGATVGAIIVSLVYVWLGRYASAFDVRIFYKDIISGRDAIWADLWSAFLKSPITGIGSSYKLKAEWMGGMFEVHNGLLDILIVHGVIVFVCICGMLIHRLLGLARYADNIVARSAVAAVFAILAASFMENFFIVPPFLTAVLALIAIARSV